MKARRVLVVGLGLIGGSLALALKQRKICLEVLGVSRSETTVEKALAKGVIDRGSTSLAAMLPALQAGDIVVIATPTLSVKNICEHLKDAVQQGVLITDVASVKGSVVRDAETVFGCLPENFIPAHPIAGSEKSGVEAADSTLFVQHQVILTPLPNANATAVQAVTAMWQAVGAELSSMSVAEHDNVLALTSHLPHMLAYTLVDTLAQRSQQQEIFRYAAGGFRDFTRIAGSDPTMWHDIALANRDALLNGLDDFEKHLLALRQAIEQGNGNTLHDVFTRAKQARDRFSEMYADRQKKKHSDVEGNL